MVEDSMRPGWRAAAVAGVVSALLLAVAGCTTTDIDLPILSADARPGPMAYAQVQDGGYTVPAVPPGSVDARYLRQVVRTPSRLAAYDTGTIVVDPANKFLYLIQVDGTSMRYGIGVGREGFAWSGDAVIRAKREWPRWHPPVEMMARDPEAAKYPNGMDGGLQNPLGARALYLYQGNRDTLYRLHGTNDPSSIGKAVSSGCVRLMNQDVIDLYNRVPIGTKVVVLEGGGFSLPSLPLADIFGPGPATPPGASPVPPANIGQI